MTLAPTDTITSIRWLNLAAIRWCCAPDQVLDDDGSTPRGGPICGTTRTNRALRCLASVDATRRAASVPVVVVATTYRTAGCAAA